MRNKNYSKQILDYLINSKYPQNSKVIASFIGIDEPLTRVYLNRLKNKGLIKIAYKKGKWNYYNVSISYWAKRKFGEIISEASYITNNFYSHAYQDLMKSKKEEFGNIIDNKEE
ncbi:MAG: hypothetical protein ACFE75_02485 [Candidatus Hodarchaeota archaeon]